MAYNVLSGTVGAASNTGSLIYGTFVGDGSSLISTPGPNAVVADSAADNRVITFTSTDGSTVQGEENLTFDGTALTVTGQLTASTGITGSSIKVDGVVSGGVFLGDGSGLTGVSAGAASAGIFTEINGSTAYTTSSVSIGGTTAPNHQVAISGSISASVNVSASAFYGAYFNIKNTVDDGATNRTMLRLHNYRADDADVNDFGPISIDFEIEQLTGGSKTGLARITAVQCPIGTDHTTVLGEKTSGLIFSTMNNNTLAEAMRINASGNLGIGTTNPSASLHVSGNYSTPAAYLSGGVRFRRRAVSGAYTASAGDYFLGVDTSAAVSISLDATSFDDGQVLVIKDEAGSASTNVITLTAAVAQTIDVDYRSVVIESPFGAVNLYTDSTNWFIF
jgi:hypothetical protein